MTFAVTLVNNTGRTVVAPASGTQISGGQFTAFVDGWGSVTLLDIGNMGSAPWWGVRVTSAGQSQVWRYDGLGPCILTLNNNQTWTVTGWGSPLTGPIGWPVPKIFPVPANWRIYLNGFTNAWYKQRITMSINGGGPSFCWTGNGENNAELCDTATNTPAGSGGQVNVAISMEYSSNGGSSWAPSRTSPVGQYQLMGYVQRVVASEDSTDNDYNDSALAVQWWVKPG